MVRLSVFEASRGHAHTDSGNGLLTDNHPQSYRSDGSRFTIPSLAVWVGMVTISVVIIWLRRRATYTSTGIGTAAHWSSCVLVIFVCFCVEGCIIGGVYGSQRYGGVRG